MTVSEYNEKIKGKILSGDASKKIKGCYIGDLLSLCMSKVTKDDLWITIQSNINVVAVASLTEAACVVICEGFMPDEKTIEKANEEDIVIISSEKSAFTLVKSFVE